jgi:pyruvate dehydrogenase E1 component
MGTAAQGRMTTHQQKKLDTDQLLAFRDRLALRSATAGATTARSCAAARSARDGLPARAREKLGGYPARSATRADAARQPRAFAGSRSSHGQGDVDDGGVRAHGGRAAARQALGRRIVPIIADEARTFGMADLFRQIGIYSPSASSTSPRTAQLSYYKEATDGQILEEGINEAGAIASWARRRRATRRTGGDAADVHLLLDVRLPAGRGSHLAAADSRSRGFLLEHGRPHDAFGRGAAAPGRIEPLVASTIPNCRAYDPALAYELAVILEDGMRRMLEKQEDVFYYVTIMNESQAQPSMPAESREGILRGMHRVKQAAGGSGRRQVMAGTRTCVCWARERSCRNRSQPPSFSRTTGRSAPTYFR